MFLHHQNRVLLPTGHSPHWRQNISQHASAVRRLSRRFISRLSSEFTTNQNQKPQKKAWKSPDSGPGWRLTDAGFTDLVWQNRTRQQLLILWAVFIHSRCVFLCVCGVVGGALWHLTRGSGPPPKHKKAISAVSAKKQTDTKTHTDRQAQRQKHTPSYLALPFDSVCRARTSPGCRPL